MKGQDEVLLMRQGSTLTKNLYQAVDEFVWFTGYNRKFKEDFLKRMLERILPDTAMEKEKETAGRKALAFAIKQTTLGEEGKLGALVEILGRTKR